MFKNDLFPKLSGLKVQFKWNQKFELSAPNYLKHEMKYQLDSVFYIKRERERRVKKHKIEILK